MAQRDICIYIAQENLGSSHYIFKLSRCNLVSFVTLNYVYLNILSLMVLFVLISKFAF